MPRMTVRARRGKAAYGWAGGEWKLGCLVQEDVREKVGVAAVHPVMPFPSS